MQKEIKRKKYGILTILCVFLLLIMSCGSKNKAVDSSSVDKDSDKLNSSSTSNKSDMKADASAQTIKGRYVETEVSLPKLLGKYVNLQLTDKDGLPFLYVTTYLEDKGTFSGYRMNGDGTWTEDIPEWVASASIPTSGNHVSFFNSTNGNEYLYYDVYEATGFRGKLLCSTDGTTYKELYPEGWKDSDSPNNVIALDDGTIVAHFENDEVTIYNKESLKIQYRITGSKYHNNILSYSDQSLILGQVDEDYNIIGIDFYDMSKNYKKTSYPIQSTLHGSSYLSINDKKDLSLCNPDGVHILETGTSLWQTVIDGSLTYLSMPAMTMDNIGFLAGPDGVYYVLYRANNDYSFMKYTYDETIDSIPSTELTVYALKDHPLLRQAAIVFQQKHPNAKVNFIIAMTDKEYEATDKTIKDDYIRALNTELLAGGGPDLIILDGLPVDSFIEKGVLSDMSDMINPKINSGELLSNIMNSYLQDGKIYYVPLSYYVQMIGGKENNIESVSTLETLANYANNHMGSSLLGVMTPEDLINTFSPFLADKIMDSNGTINREQLISVLNNLKTIGDNCGIVDEYAADVRFREASSRCLELFNDIRICVNPLTNFLNVATDLGSITQINGSYTAFENSFTPNLEIGINNASRQQELCKEFISIALSEEVQKNDYYNGFAVNKKGLIACSVIDRSNIGIGFKDKNGNRIKIVLADKEQLEKFVDLCSSVTNRAVGDEQIIAVFKEETSEFFKGNRSVNETADAIINKTQIYLYE